MPAAELSSGIARLSKFRRLMVRHKRLVGVYHDFFLLACVLVCLTKILERILIPRISGNDSSLRQPLNFRLG